MNAVAERGAARNPESGFRLCGKPDRVAGVAALARWRWGSQLHLNNAAVAAAGPIDPAPSEPRKAGHWQAYSGSRTATGFAAWRSANQRSCYARFVDDLWKKGQPRSRPVI